MALQYFVVRTYLDSGRDFLLLTHATTSQITTSDSLDDLIRFHSNHGLSLPVAPPKLESKKVVGYTKCGHIIHMDVDLPATPLDSYPA
jgi:hypothetical protein